MLTYPSTIPFHLTKQRYVGATSLFHRGLWFLAATRYEHLAATWPAQNTTCWLTATSLHYVTQTWERDQQHDIPHQSLLYVDCANDRHRNICIFFVPRNANSRLTTQPTKRTYLFTLQHNKFSYKFQIARDRHNGDQYTIILNRTKFGIFIHN